MTDPSPQHPRNGLGLALLGGAMIIGALFYAGVRSGPAPGGAGLAAALALGLGLLAASYRGLRMMGAGLWVAIVGAVAAQQVGPLAIEAIALTRPDSPAETAKTVSEDPEAPEDVDAIKAAANPPEPRVVETPAAPPAAPVASPAPVAEAPATLAQASPPTPSPTLEETLAYIRARCDDESNRDMNRRLSTVTPSSVQLPIFTFTLRGSNSHYDRVDVEARFDLREVQISTTDIYNELGGKVGDEIHFSCPTRCIQGRTTYTGVNPNFTRYKNESWTSGSVEMPCRDIQRVERAMKHLQSLAGGKRADPFAS